MPEFVIVPESKTKRHGEDATFRCQATGVPDPMITWLYNNQTKLPDNAVVINNTLKIVNISNSAHNEGTYSCVAQNKAGRSTSSAVLTIHGKL